MTSSVKKPYAIVNDDGKRIMHFHARHEAVKAMHALPSEQAKGLRVIRKETHLTRKSAAEARVPTVLLEKKLLFNNYDGVYIIEDQDNVRQTTSDKELAFELFCERGNHEC